MSDACAGIIGHVPQLGMHANMSNKITSDQTTNTSYIAAGHDDVLEVRLPLYHTLTSAYYMQLYTSLKSCLQAVEHGGGICPPLPTRRPMYTNVEIKHRHQDNSASLCLCCVLYISMRMRVFSR